MSKEQRAGQRDWSAVRASQSDPDGAARETGEKASVCWKSSEGKQKE